jgi:hypothetical protein
VLDLDGGIHQFESEQEARDWLLEDEYSSLGKLIECGDVDPSVQPPEAISFEALVRRMLQRREE